ncbi:FtsQ-type POTRA domain-containing protein [Vibrio chagasii]|nr:FtsQ-type POTRA domain-containing protein [Vibrio chagasii]
MFNMLLEDSSIGTFMSQTLVCCQDLGLEALPWVSVVSIRKQWPDTIKVF